MLPLDERRRPKLVEAQCADDLSVGALYGDVGGIGLKQQLESIVLEFGWPTNWDSASA